MWVPPSSGVIREDVVVRISTRDGKREARWVEVAGREVSGELRRLLIAHLAREIETEAPEPVAKEE